MIHCRRPDEAVSVAGKREQGCLVRWYGESRDPCRHPCTTLVLPLVLGNVQQVTVAAIQKRLHPFFASRRSPLPSLTSRSKAQGEASMRPALRLLQLTPHFLQADFAHHPPTSFTPLVLEDGLRVLRAYAPRVLQANFASHHTSSDLASLHSCCELHTTRPANLHASHDQRLFVMRTRSRAKVTKPVRSSTSRRQFLLAQETWEDLVAIDSMDTDAGGRLRVYIKTIDTGEVSAHDAAVTYAKCPQKMLRFYEKHICFI
ncbi:hypothetical protein PCL_07482 [Purpureocillium lilacinum]|uniref:Chromo shadow domain-containing protein n=1 Tax=Purpureocillium lilacinum TaxID=33203 RepID=A0A2U3DS32_PURLI|nr:hypothetical protein PCL_07482 [Purpureocillium lilacinum]